MDTVDFGNKKYWYAVQTYAGHEYSAKNNILNRVESMGMQDYVFNVFIPEKTKITKNRKGEPVVKTEVLSPGYIYIEMIVTDESWFMVRNTPHVVGLLGSSGGGTKPIPLAEEQILPILRAANFGVEEEECKFTVGQTVEIISGDFQGQTGRIDSIDPKKHSVKVAIEMFDRETLAELDFIEIK